MSARALAARDGAGRPRALGLGEMALTTVGAAGHPGDVLRPGRVPGDQADAGVGGLSRGGVADHPGDLVAPAKRFEGDPAADVAGGAKDYEMHDRTLLVIVRPEPSSCGRLPRCPAAKGRRGGTGGRPPRWAIFGGMSGERGK